MKHLLGCRQLEDSEIVQIFAIADHYERGNTFNLNKTLISFFGEPSTRTRFSFEAAANRMGMQTLTAADASVSSSLKKGESWKDTFRTLSQYGDIIVCRHGDVNWVNAAKLYSRIPVINAGNGHDEHPTQALLDAYTIRKELSRLDNLKILVCGDLAFGRTVNSLLYLMKRYNPEVYAYPASGTFSWAGRDTRFKFELQANEHHPKVKEVTLAETIELLPYIDVLYMTRIQTERQDKVVVDDYFKLQGWIERLNKKAIVLHPLPRGDEIPPWFDEDPRAAYHERQVKNGLFIRMALLKLLTE